MNRGIVRRTRTRAPFVRVVARLSLVALVVGVPAVLASFAGGPSAHLDPGSLWRAALHHRPGDARVIAAWLGRAAVLVAWIGWSWLAICVALELRAWLTGRSTVRLPASRSLQWVVAVLVGTAFAVGTAARTPAHHAAPAAVQGSPASKERAASDLTSAPVVVSSGAGSRSDRTPPAVPGDLSDGPPGAAPAGWAGADTVDLSLMHHRVVHRETLWSIAQDRLGDARRWREIAELNYGVVQADGSRLTTDHWVQPGWGLVLPATGVPNDLPRERPVAPADGPGAADGAGEGHRSTAGGPPAQGVPVAPLGAGIVGVGVADLLDRLRKVQQRHRGLGAQIRLPEPLLRVVEQRLRSGDGRADLDAVESAVEQWFAAIGSGRSATRVQSLAVTDTQVRVTFCDPVAAPPPPPFSPGDDPRTVRVDRDVLGPPASRRRAARRSFPLPTLVSVGRTSEELVMVNLEGVGSLVLGGDPHANEAVGRALSLELATSRWASAFDLVLVGFGTGLEPCERVAVVAEPAPVVSDLSWRRLTVGMRLDEVAMARADVARWAGGGGEWEPVVVVCGPTVRTPDVEALLAIAEEGRAGIVVVAIGGLDAPSAGGAMVVRPGEPDPTGLVDVLGTPVRPQAMAPQETEQVAAIIDRATELDRTAGEDEPSLIGMPDEDRAEPRPPSLSVSHADRTPGTVRVAVPHHEAVEVEVAVLGPVEIRGAARALTRAWAIELVVYLALHPGGAANDTWATALWPERRMAPSSIHSTVSVARRALGTARDGTDHLPRSHGRLELAASVGTDWARFQDLAGSDDPERWQAALGLVRGRPFQGLRAIDWTILDGTLPAIESAVVDVSGRLAGARLRAGDPRGAEWAARRGLLVSPYDERLYRMLLRTADAAGNPGGVEAVMAELVRVVADEIEPVESVHPSTLALYRSLSRRPDQALRAPARPRAS